MLASVSQKRLLPHVSKLRKCFSSASPSTAEEYTNTPQYPPILEMTPEKKRERVKITEHKLIRAVKTVEEKQIKLNMPRYYGFKCVLFHENNITYNTLPLVQHITRTHLIESNELPGFYNSLNVDSLCEKIKSEIEEAVLFQYVGVRDKSKLLERETTTEEDENILAASICQQLNRIIKNALAESYPHLKAAQVK